MTFLLCRFIMEEVDIVIVGAEGVAESGGVINKVCIELHILLSFQTIMSVVDRVTDEG